VTGRGRPAVLPPPDHHTEPPLALHGLVVTVVNKAGLKKEYDFADLPVPEPMQRSLAEVFADQSRRWTAHASATTFWEKLLVFTRFLSEQESPPQDLDGLTVAMLKRWRARHIATNTGRHTLQMIRQLLLRDPRLTSGPVAEELARRVPAPIPSKQSYGKAERERVLLAAQRQFRSARMRIRENTQLLEHWRAGDLDRKSSEWRLGQVLDHLAQTGDVPRGLLPGGQSYLKDRKLLGGTKRELTWGRLFATRGELTALAVLLTDRFGWNLSVYDHMPAPTTAPSAGNAKAVTYEVRLEKRRRGGGHWFSTENITDSGADSPGRLITQALEATAHGRALAAVLAPGTDLLMTGRAGTVGREHQDLDRPQPIGPLFFGITDRDGQAWARRHQLGGSPFQRTRRTTVTREGRPLQHTQGTHESVYVLPDEHVQRVSQKVFEDGVKEALGQAQAAVFGGRLTADPDTAHQETATADCSDEATSPWPSPDGGCGADFLLCLACPNAHVHPGHHPRLAHLHRKIRSLCSTLPDHAWTVRWRDHLLRLEDLRDKIGPAAWAAALTQVSGADRALVALLLKGDLTP
jgi:hypothetical protein